MIVTAKANTKDAVPALSSVDTASVFPSIIGTKYQTEQTASPVNSPAKLPGLLAARQTTANIHGAAIADAYSHETVISF